MKKKIAMLLTFVLVLTMINTGMGFKVKAEDNISSAQVLTINGNYNEEVWFSETVNEKWYRVEIPSDGYFTFKIMSYNNDLEWDFYDVNVSDKIAHENSWEFDGAKPASPITKEYSYNLSKGTYYIKAFGGTGRFKISASFTSFGANDEGANSYDSPKDLPLGATITGALTISDTEDWYRIQVTEPGNYAVTVKSYFSGLDWYIYDADRVKTIDDSIYDYGNATSISPITVRHNVVFTPGTYYILCKNGDKGKYQIKWEKLNQNNCSHKYETSYVGSTYVAKGYTLHKCSICGYSYKDAYTNKKKLGKGYIWSYGLQPGNKKLKVSYNRIGDVSGYQIRYSTDKKFKKSVKIVKAGKNTTVKTLKKLKRNKKYYVQVRGYKKQSGKTVYGAWSAKRSAKIK